MNHSVAIRWSLDCYSINNSVILYGYKKKIRKKQRPGANSKKPKAKSQQRKAKGQEHCYIEEVYIEYIGNKKKSNGQYLIA